jgi:hypothetical protein
VLPVKSRAIAAGLGLRVEQSHQKFLAAKAIVHSFSKSASPKPVDACRHSNTLHTWKRDAARGFQIVYPAPHQAASIEAQPAQVSPAQAVFVWRRWPWPKDGSLLFNGMGASCGTKGVRLPHRREVRRYR